LHKETTFIYSQCWREFVTRSQRQRELQTREVHFLITYISLLKQLEIDKVLNSAFFYCRWL